MAEILDARVKQKTGVAADFAGYQLLAGEIALVRTSASGPVWNFKVGPGNFDSLDWSLQNPGAAQKADTSTVFPVGVPGLYIPTEDGTYEGVTVDLSAGYTQLIWDGATLVDVVFPIDLSGYATKSEVDDISELIGIEKLHYSGMLSYRIYTDDVNFVTSSGSVNQIDNGGSDSIARTGGSVTAVDYFSTGITQQTGRKVRIDIKIDSHSGVSSKLVGIGYNNGGDYYAVTMTNLGNVALCNPHTRSAIGSGATWDTGDVISVISGDGEITFLKNGSQIVTVSHPTEGVIHLAKSGLCAATYSKAAYYNPTFATIEYVNSYIHPSTPKLLNYAVLPDRPGGATSGGFTCTGLDRITRGQYAGCWLVGNDGRTLQGDSSPYIPELVVLDMDFRRILKVIPMPYIGASVQGVAVDTSESNDTFWVATAGDGKIRHFDLDGNEIAGDVFDWATEYPALGDPNGLAYDPVNDAVWCSDTAGNTRLISCNPGASPRELNTLLLTDSPDMLHYRSGRLYYTWGSNGANGNINVCDVSTGIVSLLYGSIEKAQAIEGMYIDDNIGELTILSDGGYHFAAKPALNIYLKYKV